MPEQTHEPAEKGLKDNDLLVLAPLVAVFAAAPFFGLAVVAAIVDHIWYDESWPDAFSTSFSAALEMAQAGLALGALLWLGHRFAGKLGVSEDARDAVPACSPWLLALILLLAGLVIKLYSGRPWGAVFDPFDVAITVFARLFRAVLAGFGVFAAASLITRASSWLAAKKAGPDVIAGYLGDFAPIKPIQAIMRFFSEAESSMKQALTGETPWFVPVLSVGLTFGAVIGIESFLHLPPMTATAASAIYHVSPAGLVVDSVVLTLSGNATPPQKKRLSRIPRSVRVGFLASINSPSGLDRERQMEMLDMSLLGAFLDWVYGIRTGSELIQALPAGSADRAALQTVVDELEKTARVGGIKQKAILVVLSLAFGSCFWLASGRQWKLTTAIAVSSILWTVLLIVHELALAATSLVLTLFEAHGIAALTEFAALQFWLLCIIPQATGLGRRRCWIAGTCAFALLQATGVAAFLALSA